MKNTVMIFALLSTQAFAIVAPRGEYIALSCVSAKASSFKLQVRKHTENKSVKLAIGDKKYPAQELISTRLGPVIYTATVPGGKWTLTYDATRTPTARGHKATFVSAVYGRATTTEMFCNTVKF